MDQYTLFVLLSPFGCTIAIGIAIYGWRHRTENAARPLAYAMSAVAAYLICNTLELVNPTPQGTLFFAQLCYLFIGSLTISWLAFALAFSRGENWLAHPLFRLLWVIPILSVVLAFTNSYHHLIWKEYTFFSVGNGFLFMRVITYGEWFWVFWLQSYIMIVTGAFLMIWTSIASRKQFHMQSRVTVIGALLPLAVNLVYVLGLIPGLNKDYSPLSYACTGIFLAVSIFRYRMLDLTPLARGILIDHMNDGMLTMDMRRRVVDFNPAALRIFRASCGPIPQLGEPFSLFDPYLQQFEADSKADLLQTEIALPQMKADGYFDLQIRRLHDQSHAEKLGYLVLLHSITEHKILLQAVRKLAEEDGLTGVLNRSGFIALAEMKLKQVHTSPVRSSILMIDIDLFKQVNDTLGHIAGDQLLRAFASRLRILLRSTDLIGRIGGDEFIVLLPDTALNNALQMAERLCQQVAAEPLETKDYGPFQITISVGVSEHDESESETDFLEPAIIMADRGLYQAKALGRNRACMHEPAPT